MPATSQLNVTMGAMTFGEEGTPQARVHDLKDVESILDVFQKHGHTEIDTARVYCNGTSEEYLGKVNWEKRGLVMETKLYPKSSSHAMLPGDTITHSASDVRRHLELSLKALNAKSIHMFYLHGPDRNTPFEETLGAIDDLHKEGKFEVWGVSNYHSWEVAEMVTICRQKGWIQPTVYQGLYNAVHRAVEPELFPCLRKFGMKFYAFNPLAGGFFTGRYRSMHSSSEAGARFDPNTAQGKMYRQRYWNEGYFAALEIVEKAATAAGLTLGETALRWMSHHSLMKKETGDSVIIGASSVKHLEENLTDLEKGPLPEEVVKALDEAWNSVAAQNGKYWH